MALMTRRGALALVMVIVTVASPAGPSQQAALLPPDAISAPASCPAMSTDSECGSVTSSGALVETGLVLAYCKHSIGWLQGVIDDLIELGANVTQVEVVAKCGQLPARDEVPTTATVRTEANLGRNDHTFAAFMAHHYDTLPERMFFLKDTSMGHAIESPGMLERVTVRELGQLLADSSVGFECGNRYVNNTLARHRRLWHMSSEADEFEVSRTTPVLLAAKALPRTLLRALRLACATLQVPAACALLSHSASCLLHAWLMAIDGATHLILSVHGHV